MNGKIQKHRFHLRPKDKYFLNMIIPYHGEIPKDKDLAMPWKKDLVDGNSYATWLKTPFREWQKPIDCIVIGWTHKQCGEIIPSEGDYEDWFQGSLVQWNNVKAWIVSQTDEHGRYHPPFATIPEFMGKKNNT